MSAEYYITFADQVWARRHEQDILDRLQGLPTFVKREGPEIWLRGKETGGAGRLPYDVRVFIRPGNRPLLEINAHPPAIESDIKAFMTWLRSRTPARVEDEDGEESSW